MSLADRLAVPRAQAECGLGRILSGLFGEDRTALSGVLADPDYPTTHILRALVAEGHKTSEPIIRRHRKGECCCVSS